MVSRGGTMSTHARITERRGKIAVYWKDGRLKRHVKVCASREQAEELLASVDSGAKAKPLTVAQWVMVWLDRIREHVKRGILRVGTEEAYRKVVTRHVLKHSLGNILLPHLHRRDLVAWVNDQISEGAAKSTLIVRAGVVRTMLRDAEEEGHILQNPARALILSMRLPRSAKKRRWFGTFEQAAAFLVEAERGTEWPALALMAYTGIRIGEALGLQWEDVDLEGRKLSVARQVSPSGQVGPPKSETSERDIDLPTVLIGLMRQWRATQFSSPTPWVLGVEPRQNSAARSRIRVAMKEALQRAGLPHMTPHGLRHSYASFRALLGQDPKLIQDQMGHSELRMTGKYTHLQRSDPGAADEVANRIGGLQRKLWGTKEKA
jgi:integrase